jgi:hypothetical protein
MNVAIEPSSFLRDRANWETIFTEVNAWRGSCLHQISTVEMAVTETLLALSSTPIGANVRLRHLIGQRLEDLAVAIAPDGPFGDIGKAAFAGLSKYRERQEAFRALLCHGVIKVTVEPTGQWMLIIRSLSVRARQAERALMIIEQRDAEARLASLKNEGQRLASTLGQLRKNAVV